MATSIQVNKKSVAELLKTGGKNKFVIPEYQRSYAREEEQCQTLWTDISHFFEQKKEDTYFLGTIVSYLNEQGEQEIIDGQQRITTLFLLLRAVYKKLEQMTENTSVVGLMQQIEPCIWDVNNITKRVEDFSTIHIKSLVIADADNQTFANILKTGTIQEKAKDNYSLNYLFFQDCIDEYSQNNPITFYEFFVKLLENCILLPIECDNQETALTIFSTLNDRGLPLSDADIFKAKIYNRLDGVQKEYFIEQWQSLDSFAKNAGIKIQDLFYYYMFYLRAKEGDKDTTTPGLRKYFARNDFSKLYEPNLMDNLQKVIDLWTIIINREDNADRYKEKRIQHALSCLQNYPNEFWKYPTTIYYLTYYQYGNFSDIFANFLENLGAVLCASYIIDPTVNAIKSKIMNLNLEILQTEQPIFFVDKNKKEEFERKLANPHRNIVRMILELYTYKQQTALLPMKWEIEHILPQKRQNTSLYGYDKKEVENVIDQIGNKIPLEKKLNILAGNDYFNRKKERYIDSKIEIVKELAKKQKSDRTPVDIEGRTKDITDNIIEWFEGRRVFGSEIHVVIPTEEEVRQIKGGETDTVEFKSSMRWSYKNGTIEKVLEHPIIKTIAAFLNSKGGTLYIGVSDNGEVLGLEKDFTTFGVKGSDGFLLHLDTLIKSSLGADKHNFIRIELKILEDKEIVIVKVNPSNSPVYMKYDSKEEFYIRASASSQALSMSETMQYVQEHWK